MKEATLHVLRTLNKYKVIIIIGIGVAIALGAGAVYFVTANARRTETVWQSLWKINNDLAASAQRQDKEGKERIAALNTAADAHKYILDNMSSFRATPWGLFQLGDIF